MQASAEPTARIRAGFPRLCLTQTGLALIAFLSGCHPNPYAERRLQMRLDNMRTPVESLARSEASRPARLEADSDDIGMSLRRSAARLDANAQAAMQLLERDVDRFEAQQPVYLHEALRLLWGRPEEIEENAITLFY